MIQSRRCLYPCTTNWSVSLPAVRTVPMRARKALTMVSYKPDDKSGDKQPLSADEIKDAAKDTVQKVRGSANEAASKLGKYKDDLASHLPEGMPSTDVSSLVKYNVVSQVFLTGVSWAMIFLNTHSGIAQGGGVNVPTVLLMSGVLLTACSAFLSWGLFRKVQNVGVDALDGLKTMDDAFGHMKVNFAGVALTLAAMQAQIGTMFVSMSSVSKLTQDYTSIAAMSQAGANVLLVHGMSLLFLTMIVKKIAMSTKDMVDWAKDVKDGMMSAATPKST